MAECVGVPLRLLKRRVCAIEEVMKVLIVEGNAELGKLWSDHLTRQDHEVRLVHSQERAAMALNAGRFDVIILNVILENGSAFAVADLASYRQPEVQIIFVTSSSFFSDGSIFSLTPNARAFLQSDTPPEDLIAMVEHFGRQS